MNRRPVRLWDIHDDMPLRQDPNGHYDSKTLDRESY